MKKSWKINETGYFEIGMEALIKGECRSWEMSKVVEKIKVIEKEWKSKVIE